MMYQFKLDLMVIEITSLKENLQSVVTTFEIVFKEEMNGQAATWFNGTKGMA